MSRAEEYLYKRVRRLSDEKAALITKINEIDIETEEIEKKIEELKNSVDYAFEVFSPRAKKNDFARSEIDRLEEEQKRLSEVKAEYQVQTEVVSEDIDTIYDALGIKNVFLEEDKKDRKHLAELINDTAVQTLNNLIYKCEICQKFLAVDPVRTGMEIEILKKSLEDERENLKKILIKIYPDSEIFGDRLADCIEYIISNIKIDGEITYEILGEEPVMDKDRRAVVIQGMYDYTKTLSEINNVSNLKITFTFHEDFIEIKIVGWVKSEGEIIIENDRLSYIDDRISVENGVCTRNICGEKGFEAIIIFGESYEEEE